MKIVSIQKGKSKEPNTLYLPYNASFPLLIKTAINLNPNRIIIRDFENISYLDICEGLDFLKESQIEYAFVDEEY